MSTRPTGSACQLRPAAVPLALGETIELQDHVDVVGQHQRLDAAAQAAQAERRHGLAQLGHGADVTTPLVEGDADLKPLVTHWYLAHRALDRTRAPHACGL